MKPHVRVPFNFCLFELLSELLHSVYVFALLWRFHVFYYASCEVCTVNLAVLLLEHQEFKSEQLLDNLSTELYHLLARYPFWVSLKHTLYCLLNWLHEVLDLRLEISWLKSDRLLDKTGVIATDVFQKIWVNQEVHLRKSSLSILSQTLWSSKNFSIFFLSNAKNLTRIK